MDPHALHSRLCALDRTLGRSAGSLCLAGQVLRVEGLDASLADALARRWGAFFDIDSAAQPRYTVHVVVDDGGGWLQRGPGTEVYRLEALGDPLHRVYASYHFALCPGAAAGLWRLALTLQENEPLPRVVENAMRFLTARLALDCGGFAMHGAAVLRDGRVHIFAGPSGSGKTTAVGLTAGARNLGDDFAMVLPLQGGWGAPALPFDNAERAMPDPPAGLHPVAGIWRLHHAAQASIDYPPRKMAVASLLACVAFPWALPEQAPLLLQRAGDFVSRGRFGHLHFSKTTDLWKELLCGVAG